MTNSNILNKCTKISKFTSKLSYWTIFDIFSCHSSIEYIVHFSCIFHKIIVEIDEYKLIKFIIFFWYYGSLCMDRRHHGQSSQFGRFACHRCIEIERQTFESHCFVSRSNTLSQRWKRKILWLYLKVLQLFVTCLCSPCILVGLLILLCQLHILKYFQTSECKTFDKHFLKWQLRSKLKKFKKKRLFF